MMRVSPLSIEMTMCVAAAPSSARGGLLMGERPDTSGSLPLASSVIGRRQPVSREIQRWLLAPAVGAGTSLGLMYSNGHDARCLHVDALGIPAAYRRRAKNRTAVRFWPRVAGPVELLEQQ